MKTRANEATYARLRAAAGDCDQEDGAGTLLAAVLGAVVGGLLWGLIILAIRWVLQLPPPAILRLTAVALLFAGTAVVFVALIRVELTVAPTPDPTRGRRPGAEAARQEESTPPARPPSHGAEAPTNTPRVAGPRVAGPRALHVVRQ